MTTPTTKAGMAALDSNHIQTARLVCVGGRSEMGRSTEDIQCPFCNHVTTTYVWSRCGSGCKCSNPECFATFGRWHATLDHTKVPDFGDPKDLRIRTRHRKRKRKWSDRYDYFTEYQVVGRRGRILLRFEDMYSARRFIDNKLAEDAHD